ncbi:MFS transporter [Paraburkholderia sp. Ac-20347]|nr:MFS transporter [Paraburkholderia sp. Ac-20347]
MHIQTGDTLMHALTERRSAAPAREASFFHALILLSTVICGTLAPIVIGPVLPAMQQYFAGVRGIATLVPVVVTMPNLVLGVMAPVLGALSDRIGRKRVLVLSLLFYAIAGTAPLYLNSIYTIIGSRALVGAAEAAVMTLSTSLIGDYFSGARRDRYASLQVTIASTSAFIFNLMGGFLGVYGWRAPFAAYALPLVLAPLVQIFLWDVRSRADVLAVQGSVPVDEPKFRPSLLTVICLVAFGVGFVFMVVPIHLSFMLVQLGMHSTVQIGMAYALNSLGIIAGTIVFGLWLGPRLPVTQQFALGSVVLGAGFICMGAAHDPWMLTLGGAVNGLGCGVVLPAVVSWGLRSLPLARRGFGTGAFTTAQFVGYFCNPLVIMPMVAHWGSRFIVVEMCGTMVIVLALLAWVYTFLGARHFKLS